MDKNSYHQIIDSLYHALSHFSEFDNSSEKSHHIKWIILSTHHAAETYLRLVLTNTDPSNEELNRSTKRGIVRQPGLWACILELEDKKQFLHPADRAILEPLKDLNEKRDEIIHRSSPPEKDIKVVALSLLMLLRAVRTKYRLSQADVFEQFPAPIEQDIFMELSVEQMRHYVGFMEDFLSKEFPVHEIKECFSCGGITVLVRDCEACFEEQPEDFDNNE